MILLKRYSGSWIFFASIISLCNLTTVWLLHSHIKAGEDATAPGLGSDAAIQTEIRPSQNIAIDAAVIKKGERVKGFAVTSGFGFRSYPGGIGSTYHRGVDIAMASGTPILMPVDGAIVCHDKAEGDGAGTYAFIHPSGTTVELLAAHLSVCYGTGSYRKGSVIGLSGNSGNSTGPHLHWGQRARGGQYFPPQIGYAALALPR